MISAERHELSSGYTLELVPGRRVVTWRLRNPRESWVCSPWRVRAQGLADSMVEALDLALRAVPFLGRLCRPCGGWGWISHPEDMCDACCGAGVRRTS